MNDLSFERAYWGMCTNTYDEETKQLVYARLMGLAPDGYIIDGHGKKILDVGGGPVSLLLKTANRGPSVVIDPLVDQFPPWVSERYDTAGIIPVTMRGEDLHQLGGTFDEVWIYNCLQHVDEPDTIIARALKISPVLRIFEWIDIPPHEGHPHMLTREGLDTWIGAAGNVVELAGESGCHGRAYHGVFERRK